MKKGELKLKRVSKCFKGFWAVQDVTARFLPERITGLIGPNGAGKTTIFHIITGELSPDKGDVIYNGHSIKGLAPWQISRLGIGRMFQDVRVFPKLSVMENVIVALQRPKEETPFYALTHWHKNKNKDALKWLEFVGLAEQCHKKAEDLSYGQQKLLALARLLARGFDLLLLDEPVAGISIPMVEKILRLLRELTERWNKTIIIIEHNMGAILDATDWVYFMNEGRIYFSGRPDHVLGAKEVKELYLGLVKEKR